MVVAGTRPFESIARFVGSQRRRTTNHGAHGVFSNRELSCGLPAIPSERLAPLRTPSIFKEEVNIPVKSIGSEVLQQLGLTGKNIGVAVIDSGVAAVEDLADNLIGSYRVRDGEVIRTIPHDPLGHGTAVAGAIAGLGKKSGGVYKGAAPDAKIISLQVANEHGGARYSDFARAIRWLVQNRNSFKDASENPVPLRVINISMGVPEYLPAQGDPVDLAVKEAWNHGIVVVAAAGNDGPERMTITSAPANEPSIITVGAVDDMGTYDRSKARLAPFSSRGPTPENAKLPTLVAPGTNVVTVNVPGSMLDRVAREAKLIREMRDQDLYDLLSEDGDLRDSFEIRKEELDLSTPKEIHREINERLPSIRLINDYYIALSGTSFASPLVAGGVCQLLEWMLAQGSNATPNAVKDVLQRTAEPLPNASGDDQGAGYVHFKKAYYALTSRHP